MKSQRVARFLAATALLGLVLISNAQAKGETMMALGVELGGACDKGVAALGMSTTKQIGEGSTLHTASRPGDLYPGAKEVFLRCEGDRVAVVALVMPKGGPGNDAAKQVYQALKQKYKQVDGGAVKSVGDSRALFLRGTSVIELSVPHMSFQFDVGFYTKEFWELLQADHKRRQAEKKNAERKL